MLNGVTQLFMMKADVLNDFEQINICTHYELEDGSLTEQLPYSLSNVAIKPVYKTLKGWNQSLEGIQNFEEFPQPLLEYIAVIEKAMGIPVNLVSIGPDRTQTIMKHPLPLTV